MLNMFMNHHLQLKCHPSLSRNVTWFNIKFAVAYHPVIIQDLDELLCKGAIEPSTGGAGLNS